MVLRQFGKGEVGRGVNDFVKQTTADKNQSI